MKRFGIKSVTLTAVLVLALAGASAVLLATPPAMKMTTEVPEGVGTPDHLKTRIGALNLFDGVPDQETVQKVYDNLDFMRATDAYLNSIQIASLSGMRKAYLGFGPANTTVLQFESLMDSKALWLTPNTVSVYNACWLQLGSEPMVIKTPPNVLGLIDDAFFKYVADFGNAGPDKGKGGTTIIAPPEYSDADFAKLKADNKDAYVYRSKTYGNWVIWRGFQVDRSPAAAIATTKKIFSMTPLSKRDTPTKMNFIDVSGKYHNTIHRMDYGIYDEINEVLQREPAAAGDPELLGILAAIGIKKGQPFNPDARMKKILTDAADVAAVTVRALASSPRGDEYFFFPGKRQWLTPFVGGSHEFLVDNVRLLDARSFFHFYATGITPAMAMKMVGKGSQYALTYKDKDGKPLDGSKTYKITLPPNVPINDFWSFTLYDNQTRAMLQTDQRFPGLDENSKGLQQNADGSYDVYVGPVAPAGKEANWMQSIPGRGWNVLLRLYGPLEPWFERTWMPGDFELVK